MDDINVSCDGVVKLFKNLKPHRATGPDDIPLMLLSEAADEIAPAITVLSSFFNSGKHSFDMA